MDWRVSEMAADKTYLSCAETAKLVRKALKADFPGVKFSVRSSTYAGGASISVRWVDGPRTEQVDGTLNLYTGASFDGMTDMKSYHDSLVMTDAGPQVVKFGADFVHGSREISDTRRKVYRHELRRFLADLGVEWEGEEHRYPVSVAGGRWQKDPEDERGEYDVIRGSLCHDNHRGEWASSIIHQMAHERRWTGEQCSGGEGTYCDGCGRWQKGREKEPHLR